MKIKKGDKVKVMVGKDKGREGSVKEVFTKLGKVIVDGVNLYKRHTKPRGAKKSGGIIDIIKPISVSNVAFMCPKCGKPTRLGYRIDKTGTKTRICRKCEQSV